MRAVLPVNGQRAPKESPQERTCVGVRYHRSPQRKQIVSTLPVQPERRTRQRAHASTRQPIAEPRLARCRTPRISTPGINSSVPTVLPA